MAHESLLTPGSWVRLSANSQTSARTAIIVARDPLWVLLVEESREPQPLGLMRLEPQALEPLSERPPLAPDALQQLIRSHMREATALFDALQEPKPFEAGRSYIPASGKVIGAAERYAMVEAALDGWLTAGRINEAFEKRLADYLGGGFVRTTVSGSAANLLALSALTSPRLGARALKAGDEVIVVAASFPTTVNPIWQHGLVPVFVDITLPTYNIDVAQLEAACSERTRAVMLAHTLGNPFDLEAVCAFCERHSLFLIEDCCDALGSTYRGRPVGTFGDLATFSFYPAHQITMGEGGAVFTRDEALIRIVQSIRDWGRDCWCDPGQDNTCGKRFNWQLGALPFGYDHKYTYSHLGYNLKITEMQAACGLAQLDRLEGFIAARRRNFQKLHKALQPIREAVILPEATPGSDPSWFGFLITLRPEAGVARHDLVTYLEGRGVGTRLLFAGDLTKQPYALSLPKRIAGELRTTERVLHDTFWVGLWPGLSDAMLEHTATCLLEFFGVF